MSYLRYLCLFGPSLPPVVCRGGSCLIYVIRVCLHIVMPNTYCVVVFFPLVMSTLCVLVSLDCPYMIDSSVFSSVYSNLLRVPSSEEIM